MLKAWFIAMRPWSFTAAFVPVALGTALAWNQGFFQPELFLLTALGAISVQAGTNFINTYGDYCSGVDSVASAHYCAQLVSGALRPATMPPLTPRSSSVCAPTWNGISACCCPAPRTGPSPPETEPGVCG